MKIYNFNFISGKTPRVGDKHKYLLDILMLVDTQLTIKQLAINKKILKKHK